MPTQRFVIAVNGETIICSCSYPDFFCCIVVLSLVDLLFSECLKLTIYILLVFNWLENNVNDQFLRFNPRQVYCWKSAGSSQEVRICLQCWNLACWGGKLYLLVIVLSLFVLEYILNENKFFLRFIYTIVCMNVCSITF